MNDFPGEIWANHKEELEQLFQSYRSFCVWFPKNLNKLPYKFRFKDLVTYRKKQMTNCYPFATKNAYLKSGKNISGSKPISYLKGGFE